MSFIEDNRSLDQGERQSRIAAAQSRLNDRLLTRLTVEGIALPDAHELRADCEGA